MNREQEYKPKKECEHTGCRQLKYLIGLDLGTSTIKGVLMTSDGVVVSKEKAETEYQSTEGGSVQFDAEQFFMRIASVVRSLTSAIPEGASASPLSCWSATRYAPAEGGDSSQYGCE